MFSIHIQSPTTAFRSLLSVHSCHDVSVSYVIVLITNDTLKEPSRLSLGLFAVVHDLMIFVATKDRIIHP